MSEPKKKAVAKAKKKPAPKSKKIAPAKKAEPNVVRSSGYKGSKIEVVAKGGDHEVQVDGKLIDTGRDSDTGAYVSSDLPYRVFGSLEEIAQAIVDTKNEG